MNTDTQSQNTPQTNECHDERSPTLADRFQQLFAEHITPERKISNSPIIGYSVPLRLLRRFSIIACLNCYLCRSEDEYDPPEGTPIMAWSMNYIAIMIDDRIHTHGTKFSVIRLSDYWWAQEQEHTPNIEDVGRTIILEESRSRRRRRRSRGQ